MFKRRLFYTRACRCAAARTPRLLHLIYTIVWVAPVVTTQPGSGLYTFRPENPVYLCYDSIQNSSREANSPHPVKGILRHFTSLWSLAFGGNNMCFVPTRVCHEVCRGLCQGCAAPSQEGSQPLNTSELLNGLLEPCLLWCFPSAPGNDNHLECQPVRNR